MISKEQIAHDLAVAVAQAYIADETKRGEYSDGGVKSATVDVLSVYTEAYNLIMSTK